MDPNVWMANFVDSDLFKGILELIVGASIIAAVTPNKLDGQWLVFLKKVLNILAMNWGHAANAESPKKK